MNKLFKLTLVLTFIMCAYAAEKELAAPPQLVKKSDENHLLITRKFQGIPSLAISPKSQLWATWYAGKTSAEDKNNYIVIANSGNNGKTWTEKLVVDPDGDGPIRAFDPELWLDPQGKLWAFWSQTIGHDAAMAGLWAMTNNNPDKDDSKWSKPRRITDGIMMCKPTVLSSGEWLLPVAIWHSDKSAKVVISTNNGRAFNLLGACKVPKKAQNVDEHMIVEKNDKSLWMLVRTTYGIGESFSKDRGKTWSDLVPSAIQHSPARFFIRRLRSGNLMLIKHGPVNKKTGRSNLTVYSSKDDGKTWLGGLLLDGRNGISYPDGQQGSDGTIHIIYDYSRTGAREILVAKFTEGDIVSGNPVSPTVSLRTIVSKYPLKEK